MFHLETSNLRFSFRDIFVPKINRRRDKNRLAKALSFAKTQHFTCQFSESLFPKRNMTDELL